MKRGAFLLRGTHIIRDMAEGTGKPQRETVWSAPYIALMVTNFFQSMAAFMTNTTLPVYLDALGAATSMVGIVIGAFAITALLVCPFAGPAFDSFSRKRLLLGAQTVIAVSLVGYGVVGSIPGLFCVRLLLAGCVFFAVSYVMLWQVRDFAGLMAVAVVGSAGFGACAPLIQSMALASVPPERRGAASNTAFTGLDVGMLIGPATAGFVIEALASAMGSVLEAYSHMWLAMLVPLAVAFAVIVYWNVQRK